MRITMLMEHFGSHGGTEEYIRSVGTALRDRGHEVECVFEAGAVATGTAWTDFVRAMPAVRAPMAARERHRWYATYARERQPDMFFVQNLTNFDGVAGLVARKIPVVRFVHDFRPVCLRTSKVFPISRLNCERALGYGCLLHACSIGPQGGGSLPVSWNNLQRKLAERAACRRMDRIIVASEFMRSLLLRNDFSPTRTLVNPLFCPLAVPNNIPVLPPEPRLLYLGQVERFKGLPVLLAALGYLRHDVTLVVAGDGSWKSRCEHMAADLGLVDRVKFLGRVAREMIPDLIARAQIVVVPSVWNEPFGLVGLEAMAYGRPVVAFDVGGIREWLDHGVTGLVAADTTPIALAGAIRQIVLNRDLACLLGSEGHRRVQATFRIDNHMDRLQEVFARVCAERREAA